MVDEDVRDAWITRGWTLKACIARHGKHAEHHELADFEDLTSGEADRFLNAKMEKGQKRLAGLSEVNHQLRSALVQRKIKIQEARAKLESMNNMIAASVDIDDVARTSWVANMEGQLLSEEKQKHDMQLDLSQKIKAMEERLAHISANSESLERLNTQNKRLMKEQQADIKERQRNIQILKRQIHVLESARKTIDFHHFHQHSVDGIIPENDLAYISAQTPTLDDLGSHTDTDMCVEYGRDKSRDSKCLLRGAQAEKHLQEQRRRLQEHKVQTTMHHDRQPGRTIEDYKSLPGLNLANLLGGDAFGLERSRSRGLPKLS